MEGQIKEYLKNNLRIVFSESKYSYAPSDLRVTIYLGDDEVCEDSIDLCSMVEN